MLAVWGTTLNRTCRRHFPLGNLIGGSSQTFGALAPLDRRLNDGGLAERRRRQLPGGLLYLSRSLGALTPAAIVARAPKTWQPYLRLMRLDRPIGTWLLYLPCTWSISLAAPPGHLPDPYILLLFGVGSLLMRGAGCTVNDMIDKDIDARVQRTKDRPLASNAVTYPQAIAFLGFQLTAALAVLLQLNWYSVVLGASSLLLVAVYPLMKRITYWPQAVLGVTLNWGQLLGWSALLASGGALPWLNAILPLYCSSILWTVIYDTIYSHQDKGDDLIAGVKSTALLFGDRTKSYLTVFALAMLPGLLSTGLACDQTWPYYAGVAAVAAHLLWQIRTVDLSSPDDCLRKFKSNRNLGLMFLLAIVAGNLLKPTKAESEGSAVKDQLSVSDSKHISKLNANALLVSTSKEELRNG